MTANQSRVMELEEKIRKFGYVNDDLRSQLFTVSQRPNHLAESMGFSTAEELQAAIARRPHAFNKKSIEEAGRIIDELEARVVDHIRIEKAAQEGLADAAQEIDRMTGENSRLLRHLEEVIQEKDELAKHVEELERESGRRHPQGVYNTGLPTPATTTKKRTLPSADATPHNAASSTPHRPEAAPGMLTVTPATPSLPPLTLSADTQTDTTILRAELRALHAQYEALRLVKDRAENKYREDYLKWRGFKRWMFDESKATLSDVMVDGRTPNLKHVVKVRKRYMKTGPQTDSPGLGTEDARAEEVREAVKNNAEVREMVAALPDEFEQGMSTAPQSSLTARLLEARRPHPPDTPPVQDLSVSPKRGGGESVASTSVSQGKKRAIEETTETIVSAAVSSPLTPRRKRQRYDDSSETEEESQALPPVLGTQPGVHRLVPMPDGTYVRRGYGPYPTDAAQNTSAAVPQSPATPRKPSTPGSRRSKRSSTRSSPSSRNSTPRKRKERLLGTPTRRTPGTRERLGKENPSTSKGRPQDYSEYKGRGRYAVSARPDEDSINAQYEIDAARNNGVGHQFEEVVRDKEQRKRLHGADCECCREYYKAVGKLPPRPQAPLWRSPHATPTKATSSNRRHLTDASGVPNSPRKNRHRHGSDVDEGDPEEEVAIREHVQQISRHRQQWERPKTPPGYWEIAFPDTQEATAINKRAKEMHEEKKARIELEANRGGRYKKRKS